jgi:hypothetical protein
MEFDDEEGDMDMKGAAGGMSIIGKEEGGGRGVEGRGMRAMALDKEASVARKYIL